MPKPLEIVDWHERFVIQAGWTKQLRSFLYTQVGINKSSRILEVGCGTGVITSDLHDYTSHPPIGIDLQFGSLVKAKKQDHFTHFTCANANSLPFKNDSFDYVTSHFFFLWVNDPIGALREMKRVLKPGGFVIALAEPDYLARIDAPGGLEKLGQYQTQALISQGANPSSGRLLPKIFSETGLTDIQFGTSGFQNSPTQVPDWFASEWKIIRSDLDAILSGKELNQLQELDLQSRKAGSRVLWVPTFYAYGKKS